MSTRLGMGDGRCLTSYDSAKLLNDYIMMKNGIAYEDNFKFRRLLQTSDIQSLPIPARNAACGAPIRLHGGDN